jgi:integrase
MKVPVSEEPKKRKRGQGEGSIYKRKDGRWVAAINYGYQEGKLNRKTYYGSTRVEVATKLNTAINDKNKGLPSLDEKQTLEQYLKAWLKDVAKPRVRPRTFESYSCFVDYHIIPALGKKVLTKLTPQHVQQLLNEKSQSGLAAETVRHIHSTLRCALNDAVRWGMLHRNVASLASPPKLEKREFQVFTNEQLNGLLSAISNDRLESIFWIAIYLGLRRGEILALRWRDIDFDSQTLQVCGTLQRIAGSLQISETKTASSKRSLHMPDTLIEKLKAHRIHQYEDRLKAGLMWQETGLVFVTKFGSPLEPRNLLRKFHGILKNAKMPKIRFHDLRHSCATLYLANGVSIRTIMDVLGHSKISQTMNTYAHVLPETKRDAINLMDSILSKNS